MSAEQRFEERHALVEQHLIVGVCAPQALDQRAKQRRVRAPVFAVLQVKVVHEFTEISQARVRQAETRAQHFEGARIIDTFIQTDPREGARGTSTRSAPSRACSKPTAGRRRPGSTR